MPEDIFGPEDPAVKDGPFHPIDESSFRDELAALINKHSLENGSDTPDFLLAEFLGNCLIVFDKTTRARTKWYGAEAKNPDA